jgi:hypothetical protein
MQQTHHHKNTTHAVHKKGNYMDFNLGMNCKSEKHINSDRDSVQRGSSSPNQF